MRVRDLHLLGAKPSLTVSEAIRRAQGGKAAGPGDTKSAAGERTIALDRALPPCWKPLAKGRTSDEHVFINPATGEFWRADGFRKRLWEPTLKRAVAAGLTKQPRIHDLRHTHASWLLTDGVPLLTVSRRSGS